MKTQLFAALMAVLLTALPFYALWSASPAVANSHLPTVPPAVSTQMAQPGTALLLPSMFQGLPVVNLPEVRVTPLRLD